MPGLQQRFHNLIAQRSAQHLVHAFGHALQRAADMNHRTTLHPFAQRIGGGMQAILHVTTFPIARERQVHPREMAIGLPHFDLVGEQEVVRALALTEQQPVPVLACMGSFAQQAAQTRDAGAIADQHHRHTANAMETGVAMHTGHDAGTDRGMQRQPARAQPGSTRQVMHQAHHQFHHFITRGGGDGVFASGQRWQSGQPQAGILHRQRGVGLGQLAFTGQRQQGARVAVHQQRLQRIQPLCLQHGAGVPCVVPGRDMQDVARLPLHVGRWRKTDAPDGTTDAARIEPVAAEQPPFMHLRGRRQHAVIGDDAGQRAQLQLPLAQGRYRGGIDFDAVEQRARAVAEQPAINLATEAAVVRVLSVTQRQQSKLQA